MNHSHIPATTATTIPATWKSSLQSKSLLIAIAALALTATNAQAYSGPVLERAGLTASQRNAFATARELRAHGDKEKARNVLVEAGIDTSVIERVRSVMSDEHRAYKVALEAALLADDYQAFQVAIAGTPLADIVTTEADFAKFKEAHDMKVSGNTDGARVLFTELGITGPKHHKMRGVGTDLRDSRQTRNELTPSEQAAYAAAKAANDRETMDAILEEAGITTGHRSGSAKYLRDGRELQ
jgi:Zn-dependent membrane protease YugP